MNIEFAVRVNITTQEFADLGGSKTAANADALTKLLDKLGQLKAEVQQSGAQPRHGAAAVNPGARAS